MQKSKEDLEAIAVQFGDYTPAVAKTKSREELIASIAKISVGDVMKLSSAQSFDDKNVEEVKQESSEEPAPAPKKRGRKPGSKNKPKVVAQETPAESAATTADAPAKPKRGRKKKSEQPVEAPAEEKAEPAVVTAETEEVPAPAAEKKEVPVKDTAESAQAPNAQSASKVRKKRKISFGPGQETKEIAVTEDAGDSQPSDTDKSQQPVQNEPQYIEIEGILEIGSGDGKNDFNGFIHTTNYLPGENDAYVPGQMIRRLGLRKGDQVRGLAVAPHGKEKYAPLRKVLAVNDIEIPEDSDFDIIKKRPRFENLTAIYPDSRLKLETGAEDLSCRIIDLFCPIGKGQRGMIVSPPKAGKTVLLKKIANAITTNNPECKVIVLLIDERPEEVTDMQRSIKGEVVYSTFDKRPENHVRVTELVLERAMRQVELGKDVVILLDSMTRLARAYNLTINPTGRTLSGGLDPGSLYGPKRFFGAARNIEHGGSLTIIASALIETGSRMDEVIFEEFKGTGNMEVVLDRKLADRRVYPAIAVDRSGTRREDLLLTPEQLSSVWLTRKAIADVDTIAGTEAVLNFMKRTSNNQSFVLSAQKSFSVD